MTNDQAYNRAATLCARSEQCSQHILEKLEQWEAPNPEAVLRQLQAEHYIDDARYATAFAHDKLRYNQWGRIKIRAALRLKGIGQSDITQALTQLDDDEYIDILRQVLDKKRHELQRREDDPYILSQKLARHAASHGFEPSIIFDNI